MADIPVIDYIRISRLGGREGDSLISPALQRENCGRVRKTEGLVAVREIEEIR